MRRSKPSTGAMMERFFTLPEKSFRTKELLTSSRGQFTMEIDRGLMLNRVLRYIQTKSRKATNRKWEIPTRTMRSLTRTMRTLRIIPGEVDGEDT
ncbi:hypothetical protein DPMN_019990 [Dreissena polymorpha]|uniref:Uncharacterized protein n=1 Tax=Dreissena polymorpha TaxID=45954 RepID=A0A9D4NJJ1_DREPO|nr:hypothetical protein DPMN_019990 [Dreissena polymorpha]